MPTPVGASRFVIRATHERGVGAPSSRSLRKASREADLKVTRVSDKPDAAMEPHARSQFLSVPSRTVAAKRESRGIMRGSGVIRGVLAVCGAVAFSAPARADQDDFIMQLDNSAVYHESVVDMVDISKELPELVRHGRGDVAESVVLNVDFDDRLVDRITEQARAAAKE